MPIILPQNLPAFSSLTDENVFVMREARAQHQQIRPLRICLVNLMPTKVATETQISRMLANSPLQVELTLLHTATHASKNTSEEHLDTFYKTINDIQDERFDGMIITGAPVENMPFEDVEYWDELCRIMDYSKTHVYSTMHICWGAQAGLHYHFGLQKYTMPQKLFGIFAHKVIRPKNPLMRGFDEQFWAPHSRHTEIRRADVEKVPALRILAESDEAGLHIMTTENGRQIFICGHMEYDRDTLQKEYDRDAAKGLPIARPAHYYIDDDPAKGVLFRWRSHAYLLFSNWLNYYVYQETPYDLRELEVSKETYNH